MPADQLIALATLAVVGSFTPGPNNVIATVTGANHGLRATLPHILGVPFGFRTMLVAGSLGVAALRDWLQAGRRLARFNLAMGLLLAATALWMALR